MRLDRYLFENKLVDSRTRAQTLIKDGAVSVNGRAVTKPSFEIGDGDDVACSLENACPYVSRGGLKLEAALDEFGIDPSDEVCLDIGASSGGFTDCLLKRGAKKVYAVDSGSGQLHQSLRRDSRVVSLEGVNARYLALDDIGERVDVTVMDVSFISQTKIHSAVVSLLSDGGIFISLIKPQFEVGRANIGKGGIVKDEKKRLEAVSAVIENAAACGLKNIGIIRSPIKGGDGNIEFLGCFKKTAKEG